jgi:hypothetical protein
MTCSGRLIPEIGLVVASLFLLSADWLPAFSNLQRAPHGNGQATHFGLSHLNRFFPCKEQITFNFKNKVSAVQ